MPDTTIPSLPPRRPNSHKGHFGHALLIGGSQGMAGAIGLAGMATLRSGAGLVTLAVPECCQNIVAGYEPSYMTRGLPCDPSGRITTAARPVLSDLIASATCVACGPGLGRSAELDDLVAWLFETLVQPAVFDADALNGLAAVWQTITPSGPRIITPHPGEFRRLIGNDTASVEQCREQAANVAKDDLVTIVLKGHETLIASGSHLFTNSTGNPGMATGGSGDVLTGVITGLVCQGLSPLEAARLGTHVHGLAGDLAAAQLGQVSLIASDLVTFLPSAIQQCA